MKIISDSFNHIKEETGITDLDEISTIFIKSEEQNHSLYRYMDSLNKEIEFLEEENSKFEASLKDYEVIL